jgi:hypothetical protein
VAAFLIGLVVIVWVGFGYLGNSSLALAMTLIIGAVYVTGAREMLHFHATTTALERALQRIPEQLGHLGEWLDQVPSILQNPVRLRIEGERVGLPGPAITPYLVGLLVLLGMLGTFLGMVVTLNGAVIALEGTTDLQTIRSSLTAPVKGLGVAFGTSVAGVAASAMLGLISALCRRERLQAALLLDTRIATVLRGFSLTHQRQETFTALQRQSQALPEMVDKLQALMEQMERQSQQLNERLVAGQEGFHREAKAIYTDLAGAVDKSLRESLVASARLAGESIEPVVAATMAGIARETSALHERLGETVDRQLDGIAARFGGSVDTVAATWTTALARHEQTTASLNDGLQASLAAFNADFAERSAALLASVGEAHAALRNDLAGASNGLVSETAALHRGLTATVETHLDGLAARFGEAVTRVAADWTNALESHREASASLTAGMQESREAFAETFADRSSALLTSVRDAHAAWQAELNARDEARQAALSQGLEAMAAVLRDEWQQAGAQTLAQQETICRTLGETAREISATAQAQAGHTIGEVTRLMETAAEAPRAAAEVIGQLRQELSASMARDNALLEERSRIMETLGGLLDAINHASTEQRGAIDALVDSSANLLDRVGTQFAERIEAESSRMVDVAAQITGSAVEVASLGEAFGLAVQLFSESNEKLMAALQRIESALGKSMTRSDEQLAYYVAQAREIIDLSILSQKRVVDDLQQYAGRQASPVGEA